MESTVLPEVRAVAMGERCWHKYALRALAGRDLKNSLYFIKAETSDQP
jgi:hypothetical protein